MLGVEMNCVSEIVQSHEPYFRCRESTAWGRSTETSSYANRATRRSRRLLLDYCPQFISQLVRNFWTIALPTTHFGCGVAIVWKAEVESLGIATLVERRTSGPLQLLPSTTPL
jgi:hypothetical protein